MSRGYFFRFIQTIGVAASSRRGCSMVLTPLAILHFAGEPPCLLQVYHGVSACQEWGQAAKMFWKAHILYPGRTMHGAPTAHNKNRTRQQKGLRDRNSPTCTLSQNGYGDTCSQTLEPCASCCTTKTCCCRCLGTNAFVKLVLLCLHRRESEGPMPIAEVAEHSKFFVI